jgi:2-polyprenyl-3-methyl-5-hydroxy-6-metoxy-1,4-benzoquinol methylase
LRRGVSKQLPKETLKEQIHQANVNVHGIEAQYYERLHPEVYTRQEQKRITEKLHVLDKLVFDNNKNALDFGAGSGNLTGKLLQMGYTVTAVDISAEMSAILRKKYDAYIRNSKLNVINSPIEDLSFGVGKFDLITCYSVLHHLPDYVATLQGLLVFLKKGGVIYIEHEASPFYWRTEPSVLANLVKGIYFHSNPIFNSLYFQIVGLKVPSIDYSLSDYWHKKEHALDHKKIEQLFKKENYEYSMRTDYYQNSTWIPNPLSVIYRMLCRPEMSFWIAKK